jgi:acylglycerol lipase
MRPRRWATRFCLGIVLLALAACAPVIAPPGPEATVPALTPDAFVTRDGLHLPLQVWRADNPTAVIVALHGMSDYAHAFAMPAPWWAQHGITTYAYDQRGFGGSPNFGIWPGGEAMRADLEDCLDAVRAAHPGVPVFALGESMGGAVVLSAEAEGKLHADGIVLVAPGVWSRIDMPLHYRAALWLAAHTFPWKTFTGHGLKIWPSNNIEMMRQISRDPKFQKATRADAIYGLVNLMDEGRAAAAMLNDPPPILVVYGGRDQVIPNVSTEAMLKTLGDKAAVRKYDNGYHMILRDLNAEPRWQAIYDWIETAGRK